MSNPSTQNFIKKVSLADFKPLPDGAEQYPLEYIESNSVIRLKEGVESIHIGICDPTDMALVENLKNFHSKRLIFYQIDRSELAGYLGEKLSGLGQDGRQRHPQANEKLMLDRLANDAPIVNLVNSVFIEAIRLGASDIHIESFSEEMVIRYRLDGYLQTVNRLEKEKFPAVSTRIKIMANLNIMERRLPQDGRITVHLGKDMLDLRVSIVPIANGESIVLRLFNKKGALLSIDQLGLDKKELSLLKRVAGYPNGLILATGPTGSGKTTSLSAILQFIKSDSEKIVTIEDPIEYVIDGINQIQTNDKIGLTFDSILRRVLRQDPNIIMVGEIRDAETAELATRAALTGHLVLSTVHTKDSLSVVSRLNNLGIEPYLIAAVLKGSVAQRLVRRICDNCREQIEPSRAERELLARHGLSKKPVFAGKGCKSCHQTGYRGRIGIFELLGIDEAMEELIVTGGRESEMRSHLLSRGMKSMLKDGLSKVTQGVTTMAEVERALSG